MVKFFGTLTMRKLDLKHELRQGRTTFIDWTIQLEMALPSKKLQERS